MIQENVDAVLFSTMDKERSLGPYRIASEIRNAGYTCQVIDVISEFTDEELIQVLHRVIGPGTKIVGVSGTFYQSATYDWITWASSSRNDQIIINFFTIAKEINPDIKVVAGGNVPRHMPFRQIDTYIVGPGDRAIVEYLHFLEGNNPSFQFTINDDSQMIIDGEFYDPNFDFRASQTRYHTSDFIRPTEALNLEMGRGCRFNCKFCSFPLRGKKDNSYIRHAEAIKEDLIRNYHEFGVTRYKVTDSTFNESIEKLQHLADIAQSLPFKLEYSCYLRLDLIHTHPEQYQLLKDSGLVGCIFGIESLNFNSVKAIGKGLHPDKMLAELYVFADKLPHCGTAGSFIAGLPYETKESLQKWTNVIADKDFPLNLLMLMPFHIRNLKIYPTPNWYSEFDLDSSKYYTWLTDENWHNGDFSYAWARDFVTNFIERVNYRQSIGGYDAVNFDSKENRLISKQPGSQGYSRLQEITQELRTQYKQLCLPK